MSLHLSSWKNMDGDILCIRMSIKVHWIQKMFCVSKAWKEQEMNKYFFYGSNVKVDDINFELYCKDNVDTSGVTGTCLMNSQMITISGNINQEEIVDIAKSLSL